MKIVGTYFVDDGSIRAVSRTETAITLLVGDQLVLIDTAKDAGFSITLPSVGASAFTYVSIVTLNNVNTVDVTIRDRGDDDEFTDIILDAAEEHSTLFSDGLRWYEVTGYHE